MNVLKVAVQDLRDYLGNDARGKQLLEKVVTIANEQRKRIQALETTSADVAASFVAVRDSLVKAEGELQAARLDAAKEAEARKAADYREASLKAEIEHLRRENNEGDDQESMPDTVRANSGVTAFKSVFKEARRRFGKKLPRISCVEDVVKSYSLDEFASLGMLCYLFAAILPFVSWKSKCPLPESQDWDLRKSDRFLAKFFFWAGNNFSDTPHKLVGRKLHDTLNNTGLVAEWATMEQR